MKNDSRTREQIKEHYAIEKELAAKLRSASRKERHNLATNVYDELYRRVSSHPLHARMSCPAATRYALDVQMMFLKPFLSRCRTFLEIGPGDCAVSFEIAKVVEHVYAVDVSTGIARVSQAPDNFHLLLSDGCSIPVESNSINVAYSNQLMEHLHPDDALEQLQNIYSALLPGGIYACVTPSRLTGPHDVSSDFDEVATGLHLKEYSISELSALFKKTGFSKVRIFVGIMGIYIGINTQPLVLLEKIVNSLPYKQRKWLIFNTPLRMFFNMIRMVGVK